MSGRLFSICFICRGNRFRSPLAQAFVERLTLGLPVQAASAGTLDRANAPALPEAKQIAVLCGVDLSEHRAQRVSLLSLETTDLVIGFEEEHVRQAIVDSGAQRANTFMFRELIRLLENAVSVPVAGSTTVERARRAVKRADDLRHLDPEAAGSDGGVPDPLGRSSKIQLEVAAEIRDLSMKLTRYVFDVDESNVLPPIPEKIKGRPRWLSRSIRSTH